MLHDIGGGAGAGAGAGETAEGKKRGRMARPKQPRSAYSIFMSEKHVELSVRTPCRFLPSPPPPRPPSSPHPFSLTLSFRPYRTLFC